MGSSSGKNKSRFLGLPHGTAVYHLKKNVLFKYVKLAGDHYCFRCGQEITSVADLSIEHKQPWEGVDPSLFWDLDNIAFSHVRCNRPHRASKGRAIVYYPPAGMAWCSIHQDFLSVESFSRHKQRWNGLQTKCRECTARLKRERRSA